MVTNTPRCSEKMPPEGMSARIWPRETASVMAKCARRSKDCRSLSERNGISGLFPGFEHAQFPALLNAIINVHPETQEILCRGDQGAKKHEPEEEQGKWLEGGMTRANNKYGHGANLQDHF